jgi:hypothetical protein
MKSLKDYSPMTHPLFSMTYDEKFLEKTMGPIFKKHLNKQNSQRIIHLMSTDNGEQIAFNFIIKNILIPLLQDIENKIQELEA